jgi:peptide/nickel transport system substrate-binding protein
MFGETMAKRKLKGMALFSWTSLVEISPKSFLQSENIPSERNTWTGQNFMGYKNTVVDDLLTKLDLEFDTNARKDLVHQVLKRYTEDLPVLPLYFKSEIAAIPINLKNYRLTGHKMYETNEVEKWDLSK